MTRLRSSPDRPRASVLPSPRRLAAGRLQCGGQFLLRHAAGPRCRRGDRRAAFGRNRLHPGRHVEGRRLPGAGRESGREEFGSVDILVNNAGIQHVAPVEEFPPEKWDAIIAINLTVGVPHDGGGHPADEEGRLGPHRQHRVRARAGRLAVQVGLRRGQARHHGPNQDGRPRGRDSKASPAMRSAPAMC